MKVIYVLEYYVTGGILKMTKSAFAKEILRKDSILRKLLANEKNFQNNIEFSKDDIGNVNINFNFYNPAAISEDPNDLVKELKQRYGKDINGDLHYKGYYETFKQEFYFHIKLD